MSYHKTGNEVFSRNTYYFLHTFSWKKKIFFFTAYFFILQIGQHKGGWRNYAHPLSVSETVIINNTSKKLKKFRLGHDDRVVHFCPCFQRTSRYDSIMTLFCFSRYGNAGYRSGFVCASKRYWMGVAQ